MSCGEGANGGVVFIGVSVFASSGASLSELSSKSMWAMGLRVGQRAGSAEQIGDEGVGRRAEG